MLPENRVATHPGEILREEFLDPAGITQVAFTHHIGVPLQRVNEIIRGRRGITPETAWLFSQALGTTPQFWMNLQNACDLTSRRPDRTVERLAGAGQVFHYGRAVQGSTRVTPEIRSKSAS